MLKDNCLELYLKDLYLRLFKRLDLERKTKTSSLPNNIYETPEYNSVLSRIRNNILLENKEKFILEFNTKAEDVLKRLIECDLKKYN